MHSFSTLTELIDPSKDLSAVAIVDRTGESRSEITYQELKERIENAGSNLVAQYGIGKGDCVVLLGLNSVSFLAAYFASMSIGAVVAPLNPALGTDALNELIEDAGARLVLAEADFGVGLTRTQIGDLRSIDSKGAGDAVTAESSLDPDGPALMLYTSGSSGRPKGVVLSHTSQVSSLKALKAEILMLSGLGTIISAPLFHMNALNYVHMMLVAHGCFTLLPRFRPGIVFEALSDDQVRLVPAVPPMIARLVDEAEQNSIGPFPDVVAVSLGSAPVTEATVSMTQTLFPNAMILNGYGTTEIGPGTFGAHPDGLIRPQLSIGHPTKPENVRLVDGPNADEGVLEVQGPTLMLGYKNMPEVTAAKVRDNWYRTGDIMRRDKDGFFFFVGREDDMFVCNGENVFPIEVEAMLEKHPSITQAAVVSVKDGKRGEVPVAFITLAIDRPLDEEAVKSYALENGPAFRHPRHVFFISNLPVNGVGKVDKLLLKNDAEQRIQFKA